MKPSRHLTAANAVTENTDFSYTVNKDEASLSSLPQEQRPSD
jgi:hypothetical protein